MGILTWRNVPTPGFSGAQQGIRNASDLLERALQHGDSAADTYDRGLTEAADRAILKRRNAVVDPQEFARQRALGTIAGPDRANASMSMLQGLDQRQGVLQQRADAEQARLRGLDIQANRDAHLSEYNQLVSLAMAGERKRAAEGLGRMQGLMPEVYKQFADDLNRYMFDGQIKEGYTQEEQERWARQGDAVIEASKIGDGRRGLEIYEGYDSKDEQFVKEYVRRNDPAAYQRLWGMDGTAFQDDQEKGYYQQDPQKAGAYNPRDRTNRVAYDGVYGTDAAPFTPQDMFGAPLEDLTPDQALQFSGEQTRRTRHADEQWRKARGLPKDKGTGAIGAYMLTNGTLKRLMERYLTPKERKNGKFDFATQRRLAQHLYKEVRQRNKPLAKEWVALDKYYYLDEKGEKVHLFRHPELYKNLDFEDVEGLLLAGESGGQIDLTRLTRTQDELAYELERGLGDGVHAVMRARQSPHRNDPQRTAQSLLEGGDAIPGLKERGEFEIGDIQSMIQEIRKLDPTGATTAGDAAEFLRLSVREESFWDWVDDWGNDSAFDDATKEALAAQMTTTLGALKNAEGSMQALQDLSNYRQKYNQALRVVAKMENSYNADRKEEDLLNLVEARKEAEKYARKIGDITRIGGDRARELEEQRRAAQAERDQQALLAEARRREALQARQRGDSKGRTKPTDLFGPGPKP